MTERQTPAIVLTVRDYGEADLLVTFITPGQGRLTGIAKHARKSRRRFAHCLEPLSRVVFFLSPRPGRDLEFLQKGELVQSFPSLRLDLPRLGAAAVLAEVAGLLAGPPEAIGEIFASLEAVLELLDRGLSPDSLLPAFLLRLLTLGGYGPRLSQCLKCGQGQSTRYLRTPEFLDQRRKTRIGDHLVAVGYLRDVNPTVHAAIIGNQPFHDSLYLGLIHLCDALQGRWR
jgi:DNA repair protein RecO (recombination protein O)